MLDRDTDNMSCCPTDVYHPELEIKFGYSVVVQGFYCRTRVRDETRPFHILEGVEAFSSGFNAPTRLLESLVNQPHTQNAESHADYCGNAHRSGPRRRYKLGLKIVFLAFAFATGLILLRGAIRRALARDAGAAGQYVFAAGLAVLLSLLGSLKLVGGL